MLKVVTMLYNAVKSNKTPNSEADLTERSFDISNKVSLETFLTRSIWRDL